MSIEMSSKSSIPSKTKREIQNFRRVNFLVAVPSYNCASTINYVLYQCAKGFTEHFPGERAIFYISDGGSTDGTVKSAKSIKLPKEVKVVCSRYIGVPGKGSAIKAALEASKLVGAEATLMVDSDLRSINRNWVKQLLSPIVKGADLVTPSYVRDKYDGNITNHLCYPITKAVYGKDVRQPIGGDFGISNTLTEMLIDNPMWSLDYTQRFGIDIFITHTALSYKLRVVEAFLGSKLHEAKDPSKHLASMFFQVSGSLLSCMRRYEGYWRHVKKTSKIPMVKAKFKFPMPEPIDIDLKRLIKNVKTELQANRTFLKKTLSKKNWASMAKMNFKDETWAEMVYTLSSKFASSKESKRLVLKGLHALWLGKIADFVKETLDYSNQEAEKRILEEANIFYDKKSYLLEVYKKVCSL